MNQDTKYYELSYILDANLKEEDVAKQEEELRSVLGKVDAEVESWDSPRRTTFAYLINDERDGFFGAFRFSLAKEQAEALQETLRGNSNIIRFMLLEWKKLEPRAARPSKAPMRQAEEQVPTDEKALDEKLDEIFQKGEAEAAS